MPIDQAALDRAIDVLEQRRADAEAAANEAVAALKSLSQSNEPTFRKQARRALKRYRNYANSARLAAKVLDEALKRGPEIKPSK